MLVDPVVQAGLALCAGLMVAAACWLTGRVAGPRERTLRWDGQDWLLTGTVNAEPDRPGTASLMLDLGPWMLVRFLPLGIRVESATRRG